MRQKLTRALAVTLVLAITGASGPIQAQDRQHVVSLSALGEDAAALAERRQTKADACP